MITLIKWLVDTLLLCILSNIQYYKIINYVSNVQQWNESNSPCLVAVHDSCST